MASRVLMVATVPSMIGQFNMDNIRILQELGYRVDVATDFEDTSAWPKERIEGFKDAMRELDVRCFQVNFTRNPFAVEQHIKSCKQMKKLLKDGGYAFIHTHTPIASAITRIAARMTHTKVIYTAHGFHFYDGAPLKNWIVYYPVEWFLSRWTDVLITINKEDYERATCRFHATKTVYIPGVGVDLQKFKPDESGRKKVRAELGLEADDTMLLSVGVLDENTNYASVIKAIEGMGFTYVIVGEGKKREKLAELAKAHNVDLRLMGFRTDVADFYDAADAYVLPSVCEGLNVSLMEAMASGLPVACSDIRGNVDLFDKADGILFEPTDTNDIRKAIIVALANKQELGKKNLENARLIDVAKVMGTTSKLYAASILDELLRWQTKRKELCVPWGAKLLISVGELSVRKNHKVVVEALQSLPENYWYVIVGKGELAEELAMLDKTGRLKLLGYRSDVKELLRCSDLFVFPSLQEGLPVALMEAVATGIPCVASNIRGNNDLISCNVDAKDVGDWVKAILDGGVYGNVDEFSLVRVREKMKDLYGSVINAHPRQ